MATTLIRQAVAVGTMAYTVWGYIETANKVYKWGVWLVAKPATVPDEPFVVLHTEEFEHEHLEPSGLRVRSS